MVPKNSEIYSQALIGVNDNVEKLASVIKEIEDAIDKLVLKPIYEDNKKHLKTLAEASMVNPSMVDNESLEPLVNGLKEIQHDLGQTYQEMTKVQTTMTLLQGRDYAGSSKEKAALDDTLKELNNLNNQFNKTSSLLQKQAVVLANQGQFAQPKQQEKLDEKLKKLHEHVKDLKEQAKKKKVIANKVDEITRPKPGKM